MAKKKSLPQWLRLFSPILYLWGWWKNVGALRQTPSSFPPSRGARRRQWRPMRLAIVFMTTLIFTVQFTGLQLLFTAQPAAAATTIKIEPITWDFVGLDSNKPESQGPNTYVVGARVCNVGGEDALNVRVTFVKDGVDNGYAFIRLQSGDTYTFDRIPADDGTTTPIRASAYIFDTKANGALYKSKYQLTATPQYCQDFYYNFEVTRTPAAWNTYQKYYIEASASNAGTVRTERPRQSYIEKLISQARNEVYFFGCDPAGGTAWATGNVTVQVGDTFTCQAKAKTATAYPQMSFTSDIPNVIFQVLNVNSTYSNPPGGVNSTVYADGCGWVSDPTDPRYHLSPGACSSETTFPNVYSDQYPYLSPPNEGNGGVGNDITTNYKIKVIAFPNGIPNPIKVSNVILDYSGSSYHYNADYGISPNVINITVANPNPTDLSVTKSHTGDFSYGDNTYTLTVADNANGTGAKSPVTLKDTLPTGFTFKDMNTTKLGIQPLSGADASNWNCSTSGQVMTCLYDTNGDGIGENFPDGGSNTLTLNINIAPGAVPNGSTRTNFATVALNSAQTDSNLSNNTASDPTTVLALPNLALVKTSSPASPAQFDLGTASASYTLTATNSTLFDISGPLTLVDSLPIGITFNSVDTLNTSAGWSCASTDTTKQTVRCTNGSGVPSGTNTKVTLKVDVSGSVEDSDTGTAGIQVTNRASITTGSQETSLVDNTATITNTVNKPLPDVAIFKTDNNLAFIEGTNTNYYFITVTNVGGLPTTGTLTIRDTLPQFFNTSNVSQGYLTSVGVVDPATGLAPTNWSCTTSGTAPQTVTCNSSAGFALAPGQSSTLRFQINIPNVTNGTFNPVTNTATIDAVIDEIILSNNTSSDTTNIVSSLTGNQSNIGVSKATTTTPTGPGQSIAYELIILNDDTNQDIAKGLFEDIVPSQITGVTASCSVPAGGGTVTYNGTSTTLQNTNTATCCTLSTTAVTGGTRVACASNSFITLAKQSGGKVTAVRINISGTVAASGNIYNGASVSIDPTDAVKDKNAADNYDSVANNVPGPTLGFSKTPIPTTFAQGELVSYRLSVNNPGTPNTLSSVGFLRITDPLPSQYTYISSSSAPGSSGWQCDAVGQNVTCFNNTTLPPNTSTAVDLLLRVNGNGSSITNTATLTRPDGTTVQASDTQNIPVAIPDLTITKTANNIAVGQQGSYTIKVQNIGSGKAAGPIIVRDTLPNGLSFVSGSGTGWNCSTQTTPSVDPKTVICTNYSDIASGNTFAPDLTLNVLVSASASGNLSNTAKVNLAPDSLILGETAFGNNTTTISTPVATQSDLSIAKTAVDQDSGTVGIQFYKDNPAIYQLTVTNNGPSAYTGVVQINDPLDTNLSFLSLDPKDAVTGQAHGFSCSGSGASFVCSKPISGLPSGVTAGLKAGEIVTLNLNVNVSASASGTINNTATLDQTNTLTPANDPVDENNNGTNDITQGGTDVVTNDRSTVSVAILNNATTLTLAKDDNDGTGEPTNADLQTKFVKGGIGKYTIIATNTGNVPAKAPVTINESLPSGLTYAGYSQTANWSCTGTIGGASATCIYGQWTDTDNDGDRFDPGGSSFTQQDLPPGASSGVEIQVNVLATATTATLSGSVYTNLTTNTASVSGSNFTTVNASEQTAIIDPADLAVTKSITPASGVGTPLDPSENATYTITVTNNGPGTSYPQIYLQDYLPPGLSYQGTPPAAGTSVGDGWVFVGYNSGSNEVTYRRTTALNNGATTSVTLPVQVAASPPASVTNFVRVGGFTPEPDYDTVTPGYQDPKLAACDSSFGTNQPVNNCYAITTPVVGGSGTNLKITKLQGSTNNEDPGELVTAGANYDYTLKVENISSTDAVASTVTDVLPAELTYVSSSFTSGGTETVSPNRTRTCSYDGGTRTLSCNLWTVKPTEKDGGTAGPIQIKLTVKTSATVQNTATVSSYTADTATADNSDWEKVSTGSTASDLILAKRITAVRRNGATLAVAQRPNGQDTSVFNDYVNAGDPLATQDNDGKWPTPNTYLRGAIDAGQINPDDEVEYTIYFLNRGSATAKNVMLCDVVPDNMIYVPGSMTLFLDNAAPLDAPNSPGAGTYLTAIGTAPNTTTDNADGDRATFYPPSQAPAPAGLCKKGATVVDASNNDTGAVVFRVVDGTTTPDNVANATAAGTPTNSYGFVQFRAKVKQ